MENNSADPDIEEFTAPQIPAGISDVIKFITWLMIVTTVSIFSTFHFRSWFYHGTPQAFPLFFVLENVPNQPSRAQMNDLPLRKHSFLQANFSLVSQYHDILQVPVEYLIDIELVVPDYEIAGSSIYDEGMFLTCLKFIDKMEETVWPLENHWTAEVPLPHFGRCRSSLLVKSSLMQTVLERLWSLGSLHYWHSTRHIVTQLDDGFTIDVKKKPSRGIVTLLSYDIQVIRANVKFAPKLSWLMAYPRISAMLIFNSFFCFYFFIFSFVKVAQL